MATRSTDAEEIITRGIALYSQQLKATLEREQAGRFVVIDVDSGDFEVADEDWEATRRLRERRPGCMTYGVRIGSDVAYEFKRRTPGT